MKLQKNVIIIITRILGSSVFFGAYRARSRPYRLCFGALWEPYRLILVNIQGRLLFCPLPVRGIACIGALWWFYNLLNLEI